MSKSHGDRHVINIFDDKERIKKQIRSAVTDSGEPSDEMSPGVKNLLLILRMSGGEDAYHILTKAWEEGKLKYSDLKGEVSEALLTFLAQVKDLYREIQDDILK